MAGSKGGPGYFTTINKVYKIDGFTGFYRGWVPPMIGSILFRSSQFTAYEMWWTMAEEYESMKSIIPLSGGI